MNSRQKEVYQATLHDEQVVMKRLESNYTSALARIRRNIKELQANPLTQSKAYQLEFQKQLEAQISGILDTLQGNNFTTIADYLNTCYQTGFIDGIKDSNDLFLFAVRYDVRSSRKCLDLLLVLRTAFFEVKVLGLFLMDNTGHAAEHKFYRALRNGVFGSM